MLKKIALLTLAAILFVATVHAPAQTPTTGKTHHVIFVVTSPDPEDWNTAMVLADHFVHNIRPEPAEVEVLAYGAGIPIMAKTTPTAKQMTELMQLGVHFVACETAMRAHNITRADLLPGVTSVPSGIVELVRKQEAGYVYVKVGR